MIRNFVEALCLQYPYDVNGWSGSDRFEMSASFESFFETISMQEKSDGIDAYKALGHLLHKVPSSFTNALFKIVPLQWI